MSEVNITAGHGNKLRPPRHEGQVCVRCVMDTSDRDIMFDDAGVCSHCHQYDRLLKTEVPGNKHRYLDNLLAEMKRKGANRSYDCVIGISGGVDSTFVAWLCKKKFGLRPLAVHLDNGWNSELAVHNIEMTLRQLDIDLHTHVVDWQEFRDIQVAFLKSSISNWELPTDHAIQALLYQQAVRLGVKYIITGSNMVTEALMPRSWVASATDLRLLRGIHRRFGTQRIRTFPTMSMRRLAWLTFVRRIRQIPILNYVDYNKDDSAALLKRELGWTPYAFKHGESLFTKFYQRHYLPSKFGRDKRLPHLANLVLSKHMTRTQALEELAKPLYVPDELERDLTYVAKKLELAPQELHREIAAPPQEDDAYPNSLWLHRRLPGLLQFARRAATDRRFDSETTPKEKINLHLYPSPLKVESRMLRITAAVGQGTDFDRITLVGLGNGKDPERRAIDNRREIVRLTPKLPDSSRLVGRSLRFLWWYVLAWRRFRKEPIACINPHSLSSLPLAVALKLSTGARLIYDTHELETETIGSSGVRKLIGKITEASLIRFADAVVVVGPRIGEWYADRYKGLKPVVIRNLPEISHDTSRRDLFRSALGIPSNDLIFFYQGVLDRGRGVETTLAAFAKAPPDRHVVFLGFGRMQAMVEDHARRYPNIHFHPAVPPGELRQYTKSGDVGLCIISPLCLSYRYGFPNKLFEYMACGVPVIATDLPEIGTVVKTAGAGWTIENSPEALLDVVTSISLEDARARGRGGLAWTRENSWEQECERLQSIYVSLGFANGGSDEPADIRQR